MKKFITPLLFSILFIGISVSVLYYLPNEIAFKTINEKGIDSFSKGDFPRAKQSFERAQKKFTPWDLISKNNTLGLLYAEKKYKKLEEALKKITKQECAFDQKSIPKFCENIFYLQGITQYRLGENLEKEKQKKIFENSISDFQKTLVLNPKNTWAKENIDFILKRFQEKKEDKSSKNSKSKDDSEKNKANQKEEQDKNSSKKSDQEKGSQETSRLPQKIQEALEQTQQDLEDQSKNQTGFNRSLSAAQNNKNNTDPFDPFQNDPFFQKFFGNDPFFNRPSEKNFNKTISNPNEKDW